MNNKTQVNKNTYGQTIYIGRGYTSPTLRQKNLKYVFWGNYLWKASLGVEIWW